MPFSSFGDLAKKQYRNDGMRERLDVALALERAAQAVVQMCGERVSSHVKPLCIKDRVLLFACASAAASSLLGLREREILSFVNEVFPKPLADTISCRRAERES